MSRQDYAAEIVRGFAESAGLPKLALDAAGRAGLFVNQIPVHVQYSDNPPLELLWLTAELGAIPADDREALAGCLGLSFHTWIGNRMTVALRDDGRGVIGHTAIPVVNLDLPLFKQTLAQLVETATLVRDRILERDFDSGLPNPRPTTPREPGAAV